MKTSPMGVRFEEGLLRELEVYGVRTGQQAVNFLTKFWRESQGKTGSGGVASGRLDGWQMQNPADQKGGGKKVRGKKEGRKKAGDESEATKTDKKAQGEQEGQGDGEKAPETFTEFLRAAEGLKRGSEGKFEFLLLVRGSKLTPNQKEAVFARLKS